MKVPLLDLQAQYQTIKKDIDKALMDVVASQYFILSGEVKEFEEEVAKYVGGCSAAGVASGTDALILALKGCGVGKGDLVITTPFTFFATAESISVLGAKPIFVDIDPGTYNIDPLKIEEYIESASDDEKKNIKAIVPVHLYGQCADMGKIMTIAKKYDLKVVEDSAQAIGATFMGRQSGSFGSAGAFSFFPSKNLGGFGDGGMVVSSEPSLIEEIKKLRVHGSRKQYVHEEIGYNSRLDSLQAAILRVKLKNLDKWIEQRAMNAEKYNEAFAELPIVIPKVAEGNNHTYHQYTIAVDERDELLRHLNDKDIAARVYYPVPLHLQPCYKDLGYSTGSFPISEEKTERVLSLPVYPELTDKKTDYVIQTIKDFFGRK
ncbi:DegT/DnrJ/EryC1/StrS family aminotransferase [Candidatus Omnitrophota bacterium]